jgi:hypothetical protein
VFRGAASNSTLFVIRVAPDGVQAGLHDSRVAGDFATAYGGSIGSIP